MAASAELSNADLESPQHETAAPAPDPHGGMAEPAVVQRSARGRLSIIQRRPASLPDRAFVMRRAQRSYGNQVALASVQRSARTVQRACACGGTCESCAPKAAEEQQVVQRQAATAASDAATAPAIPDASEGRPLDAATRQAMEAHTGRDLADVRIHTDTPANQAAVAFQADAFTVGRDIYFGEQKYQPDSADGGKLLVHELTHVEQQAQDAATVQAAGSHGDVVVGAPDDPLEHEAESRADAFDRGERSTATATADSVGVVRRAGWNSLTDNPIANKIASGVEKGKAFIGAQIDKVAPGAIAFFRNIRDYFKNAISRGVDGVFGGLLSSIREKGLVATIQEMVASFASGAVHAVGGFISGHCAAMGELAEYLLEVFGKIGGAAIEQAKKGFDAIRGALESVWDEYGAPALDWVKKKLKAIWKDVEDTARKFWDLLKPLREGIGALWNEVTDYLIESRRSFSEWLDWFVPKALDAWEELKPKIKPYMEHVKTGAKVVGTVVLLLSPAGPFVIAGAAIYGLYRGVKTLWDKWGQGFTKSVREWLANHGLAEAQAKLKELQSKAEWLKGQVQGGLNAVHAAFMSALQAIGAIAFLQSVKNAIASLVDKVRSYKEQLDHQLDQWMLKLRALLVSADPYLQQLKEAFRQSLLVALFGPMAFLDDGVWDTIKKFTALVMRTPCLREIGGLLRVPTVLQKLSGVRDGIKQGWEVVKNPGPLLEQFKAAIAPYIAKIEPAVRAQVEGLSDSYTEREQMIQASIWHYLGESLSELKTNWWSQLKTIGGDLLWPWPSVAKDFMPMVTDFGNAVSSAFNLEFSTALDQFLAGMKKFNGIAGNLAGWFTIAAVLIGGALGALGFAFGPAGVATVGAGAAAGLELAEGVGIALLGIALATEAVAIVKASADLKFQNPRIENEDDRKKADQDDCKAIAGSFISVATIGALILLADIAAKFAKFLYSLVEEVPIVKNVSQFLKDVKGKVGDFGLKKEPVPGEVPLDAAPKPLDQAVDVDKPSADTAAKGEEHGVPREQLEREFQGLKDKATDPANIHKPKDPRFDAEIDVEGHSYEREAESHTWCRASDPICPVSVPAGTDAAVDAKKAAELGDAPKTPDGKPTETKQIEPATETKLEPPQAEDIPPEKKAEMQQELDDLKAKKKTAEDRWNERRKASEAEKKRAEQLRTDAVKTRNPDLLRQARAAEEAAAQAARDAEAAFKETVDAQLEIQKKAAQLNTDLRSRLCFAAGTTVWTPSGTRPIESLVENDVVLAYDFDDRSTVQRRILEVCRSHTDRFYDIHVDGRSVRATSLHRFWVESARAWIEARDLRAGMILVSPSGRTTAITRVEICEAPRAASFNLHVEASCTYFVGPGVLVHNAGGPAYNFGPLRIYEGVNPKFPGKVYIGQTDDVVRRQGEHRAEAIEKLKDPSLTPEQREFWEFKKDIELRQRVAGLDPDMANYLEQRNMDLERAAGRDVMNRREQVSRENIKTLEQRINADPRVQEAGLSCP